MIQLSVWKYQKNKNKYVQTCRTRNLQYNRLDVIEKNLKNGCSKEISNQKLVLKAIKFV